MGDEEEGMEAFDINETDFYYAMNPGSRPRFQSKDEATYGVFAANGRRGDDSDDDDENTHAGSGRRVRDRRAPNYSKPLKFISGGVTGGKSEPQPSSSSSQNSANEFVNEAYERPRRAKQSQPTVGGNVFAGMRTSSTSDAMGLTEASAEWTKKSGKGSVIMGMMKKMGFVEGKGLGANKQGIVEPVQAVVRKGRGAVGAYGKEGPPRQYAEKESDEQAEKDTRPPIAKGSWKKSAAIKTRYKTIDEVLQEESVSKARGPVPSTKVIDMTGPEQRIYSGYESFSMKTKTEADDTERDTFDIPELRENINLLLDLTEEAIRKHDHQLRTLKDQNTALQYDLKQIHLSLEQEEKELERMKDAYELVEKFSDKSLTMNDYQDLFSTLQSEYATEYKLYELETIAIPCVLPLIQHHFASWDPLNPDHQIFGIDLMKEWQSILGMESKSVLKRGNFEHMRAFDRLIWEGWMPSLRRAVLKWDPRDQMEVMLRIIETWLPILPNWIKENILDQIIIPRIGDRVSEWDPCKDIVPIHSWLVPWLVVLGDRLQPVLHPVRMKLAKALKEWQAGDLSALAIIRPWSGVWAPATMSSFLSQNIIPKLEKCFDTMELDPLREKSENKLFDAAMAWLELIHPELMANVMGRYFFPRWYDVLYRWLSSPHVNVQQVKEWFMMWQSRFPPSIADFPIVKENIRRGMIAIAQSSSGQRIEAPAPIFGGAIPQIPMRPTRTPATPAAQMSLREVLEVTATRNGITYVPQKDRFKDGRQVFWFGPLSIYFDGGIVYVMDPQQFSWRACGMDELLQMANV